MTQNAPEFSVIPPAAKWEMLEPYWARNVGLMSSAAVSRWVRAACPLREQVRADDLYQLEPVVTAFRARPHEIRAKVGKAAWKKFHHSSQHDNAWRAKLIILTKLPVETVLAIPKGGLRRAFALTKRVGLGPVEFAAHRCSTGKAMIEIADLAHDLERMGGTIDMSWTAKRMRREHDALAEKWVLKFASPDKWAEDWSHEVDGYTFTLLRSEADFKREAMTQKHCVASYHDRAKRGVELVFKIEGVERATVAWNVAFRHMEIKASRNSAVTAQCRSAAMKALHAYIEGKK